MADKLHVEMESSHLLLKSQCGEGVPKVRQRYEQPGNANKKVRMGSDMHVVQRTASPSFSPSTGAATGFQMPLQPPSEMLCLTSKAALPSTRC